MIDGTELVKLTIGFLSLWVLIFWAWRDYRLDAFREKLFALRAELFDFAARGKVSFDHPAYTILRGRMNAMIRLAHVLTMTRLIIVLALKDKTLPDHKLIQWQEAVEGLDSVEVKANLKDFHARMIKIISAEIGLRSVTILLLAFFIVAIALLKMKLGKQTHVGQDRGLLPREHVQLLESQAVEADQEERAMERDQRAAVAV